MNDATFQHENDLEKLRSTIGLLTNDLSRKEEKIAEQSQQLHSLLIENDKLKSELEFHLEQFRLAQHQRSGNRSLRCSTSCIPALVAKSSEKMPQQESLFNEAEAAVAENPEIETESTDEAIVDSTTNVTRARPKRKPIPAHFPREEIVYDLTDEEKVCPHASAGMHEVE